MYWPQICCVSFRSVVSIFCLNFIFQITRTVKFLSAISVVSHIVTPSWIEESNKAGTLLGALTISWKYLIVFDMSRSICFKLVALLLANLLEFVSFAL